MNELYKYMYYIKKGWSTQRLDMTKIQDQLATKLDDLDSELIEAESKLAYAEIMQPDEEIDLIHGCTVWQGEAAVKSIMGEINYFQNVLKQVITAC